MNREQWAQLVNPCCSACHQPVRFDGTSVEHMEPADSAACYTIYGADHDRKVEVDQ